MPTENWANTTDHVQIHSKNNLTCNASPRIYAKMETSQYILHQPYNFVFPLSFPFNSWINSHPISAYGFICTA